MAENDEQGAANPAAPESADRQDEGRKDGDREAENRKDENGEAEGERPSRLKALFRSRAVQVVATVIVIVAALIFWWHSTLWESTDDAQIDGHLMQVSSRVAGQVTKVRFEDNQLVKANGVLVEIDPTDYQVAYERAQAELADAVAAAEAARAGVPITSVDTASQLAVAGARVENARSGIAAKAKAFEAARARLHEAQANSVKARSDLSRYAPLAAKDIVSREQYDAVVAAAKTADAAVDAADASMRAAAQEVNQARDNLRQMQAELRAAGTAPQQVSVSRSRSKSAEAALKRARAGLEQARLNLQYTRIIAPVDGITGKKAVEPGQNVQPGQALLYLVPVEDIWVTANFKETQLRKMRPGQRVEISIDAFKKKYDGHLESFGAASGSRFSLFPPENATGNYVKVVQRIPVRIRLAPGQDPDHRLRPGMSVVPKVRVR
jgi:membrane fusion protein, multidrug efflux system